MGIVEFKYNEKDRITNLQKLQEILDNANTDWFFVENGCWYGKRISPREIKSVMIVECYKHPSDSKSINTFVINEEDILGWYAIAKKEYEKETNKYRREQYIIDHLKEILELLEEE